MNKEEYEMDEFLYRAADESYEERYEVEEDV